MIDRHPNAVALKEVFALQPRPDFVATGVTRAAYLKLIAANVDFFKKYQDGRGAIIDPVSKGERQYSTPAFAVAAGLAVRDGGRPDLLQPASRALSCALTALVEKRAADEHADFYIPMLVHAFRLLKDAAPAQEVQSWRELFKRIDPGTMYRKDLRGMNWNIVSSCGELLRRHDGLVADDRRAAQMQYLEGCLAGHLERLMPAGLFHDPGAPMIYDAFSRLWLEDMDVDQAYDGQHAGTIRTFLRTGGLSTLLLLSPSGEWATGGRSGLHNWGEAQIAAICEINAVHWQRAGRADVAGAFKRAAHLAFQSVARWQRPSGELWIIRNRAEPETRLAYEPYSNHSQYNLLPMAMLAIAYSRADESIAERPTPAEVGSYVFDLRQTFHKVVAAAGGYQVLIDTAADPKYNATGLQRVHRAGVAFPALSDSAAPARAYGPKEAPMAAISPGITWKSEASGEFVGLAHFSDAPKAKRRIRSAELVTDAAQAGRVSFQIKYDIADAATAPMVVTEDYVVSSDGVRQTSGVSGISATSYRAHLPVLVADGAEDTDVQIKAGVITVSQRESVTTIAFGDAAQSETPTLLAPRIVTHSGYVQEAVIPTTENYVAVTYRLSGR